MVQYQYFWVPTPALLLRIAIVLSNSFRRKLTIFLMISQPLGRDHIPQKASAVVFSVPCPLDGGYRPDVSKVDGGILLMDTSSCTPRTQHCLLPHDQVRAMVSRCFLCSSTHGSVHLFAGIFFVFGHRRFHRRR